MKLHIRLVIALGAMVAYLAALRFVAPPNQPYFILGIGIVGLVSWNLGIISGLISMFLLVPLTSLIYQQFPISTSYIRYASSPAYIGLEVFLCFSLGYLHQEQKKMKIKQKQLEEDNAHLQRVLSRVKELGGVHNICSGCKKIQDDAGQWQSIDTFLKRQTKMEFSHCICTDCGAAFQHASQNLQD